MKPLPICVLVASLILMLLASYGPACAEIWDWDASRNPYTLPYPPIRPSFVEADTVDILVQHTASYPGRESLLVTVSIKNPMAIVGFDLYLTLNQPDLVNFSTVRIFVDSIDTCEGPEESCWVYLPVRECLGVPGALIEDWFFRTWGEVGDTTRLDCKYLRALAWDIFDPIPAQPEYAPLFQFGVDVLCVPDSLSERTLYFFVTGELSDEFGFMAPFRSHYGELAVLPSVPGDASSDSLVDVADAVCLLNYVYKSGPEPCVMEAADPNADCQVDLEDVLYILGFLFRDGSPPEPGCAH